VPLLARPINLAGGILNSVRCLAANVLDQARDVTLQRAKILAKRREIGIHTRLCTHDVESPVIARTFAAAMRERLWLKPSGSGRFGKYSCPAAPHTRRGEATVKGADGKTFKVSKGAPQVILALSANAAAAKSAVDKAVDDFAARGFRALGVAPADDDGKWQLLGVLPLFDPPRDDAKSTVATAAQMGVKIKMVTGDALAIAREMAKTLGMGSNILDANTLGDSKTKETATVAKTIEDADGFAQVRTRRVSL
jgi:haloacid dehalogenase-like hydrolase